MSLYETYNLYFRHVIARTDAEREIAFRLRYRVYCEETGFLPADINPDGLERDCFDEHASQCLLIHRASDKPVGTVRLVLPQAGKPGCDLPARLHAPELDRMPDSVMPAAQTAEISRFTIIPEFRKRTNDTTYAGIYSTDGLDPRRVIPNMTLGLMAGITEMALEAGMSHLCAIIDPALLRILRRLGLIFECAGPEVDFHGMRQPVWCDMHDLLAAQALTHPEIASVLNQDGRIHVPKTQYAPAPAQNRAAITL